MTAHPQQDAFRILFVCTGNVCRSPLAERLTAARLGGLDSVSSAGTRALVGHPMDDRAAAVLRELGGTPDGFRARQLEASYVAEADLVLTASRLHRAAAVQLAPRAVRRAFTLREFGRLVAGLDKDAVTQHDDLAARGRALVAEAAAGRGLLPPAAPGEDDVPDPIGRPPEVHWKVGVLVADALAPALDLIAGQR